MKEKPTVFQLAQLAAQASAHIARPKDAVRRAWDLWCEAEAEIEQHDRRAEFLRNLFWTPNGRDIPIFSDSPEDWKARQKAYPGDERDVDQAMWNQTFPRELVEKQLFRDRTLSKHLRHKLFLGLVRLSIRFDMPGPLIPHAGQMDYFGGEFIAPQHGFPIHPKNLECAKKNYQGIGKMLIPAREVRFVKQTQAMLSEPKLYAHLVRWSVDVRQKHLEEARTRDIPESIKTRQDERGGEENIQFKRKHRQ